jgi:hypothetical protein
MEKELDPVEPQDVPVESQDNDTWADDAVEAEPGASKKGIKTRAELKRAGAVVILSRWRQGLSVVLADVVDGTGFYPLYQSNGLGKSLGDALGGNKHGFKLVKKGDTFIRDANNVKLIFKHKKDGLPQYEHEGVAIESGFEGMAALRAWVRTLPEFLR